VVCLGRERQLVGMRGWSRRRLRGWGVRREVLECCMVLYR
jgi:hypothetical protein